MKIFVSYASEYRRDADAISIALRQEGHTVFFDRDALPAGDAYHARIRGAIEDADLCLFLIAPESVDERSYAMTELGLARARWPDPTRHILPVIVKTTPIDDIPEYLKAITFVEQDGNLVAGVVARVARLAGTRRRRMLGIVAGTMAVAVAIVLAWIIGKPPPAPTPCYLYVSVADPAHGAATTEGLSLDVSYLGSYQSFSIPPGGDAPVHVGPLTGQNMTWTITLRARNGSVLGSQQITGCPTSKTIHSLEGSIELTLTPRAH